MFDQLDNKSSNKTVPNIAGQQPAANLPTNQANKQPGPQGPVKGPRGTEALSVNIGGKVEDIFANSDRSASRGGHGGFKVKSSIDQDQPATAESKPIPDISRPDPQPSRSLPRMTPVAGSIAGVEASGFDSSKLEFDDKPKGSRKKYFVIGIVGLVIIGGGALAYVFLGDSILSITSQEPSAPPSTVPLPAPTSPSIAEPPAAEPSPVPPAVEPSPILEPVITDTDKDGLTDSEELAIGTSILKADTDADGLFDKEEVEIYLTNPLDPDSDEDGYLDGEEVENGFNPKGPGKLLPDLPR